MIYVVRHGQTDWNNYSQVLFGEWRVQGISIEIKEETDRSLLAES
ncbi:hypothetical protein [Paenibacillus caseinilyticus]|nr:hypothetical protein [Paenibacillus caseinilyticus]MCZ8520990.1 hypothetical protein [Paenibacillus caseinilyticus]